MRCPRGTPTNTLIWFCHVTKRTTCLTLLFQSLKGSDPFPARNQLFPRCTKRRCPLPALGNQAAPHQNGAEPALSAYALIKKASPQSAQDEGAITRARRGAQLTKFLYLFPTLPFPV